jgi:hypothetical protein
MVSIFANIGVRIAANLLLIYFVQTIILATLRNSLSDWTRHPHGLLATQNGVPFPGVIVSHRLLVARQDHLAHDLHF